MKSPSSKFRDKPEISSVRKLDLRPIIILYRSRSEKMRKKVLAASGWMRLSRWAARTYSYTPIPRHEPSRQQSGAVRTTSHSNCTRATRTAIQKRTSGVQTWRGEMSRRPLQQRHSPWQSTQRNGTVTRYSYMLGLEWVAHRVTNAKPSSDSAVKDRGKGRA